ncbi:MAG: tyrosine-type recombinase/integrase [bacterium]
MRIYKHKNGVWYLDYSLNGKRVRKSIGRSKKLALEALKAKETDIIRGKHLGVKQCKEILFDDLCQEYLNFSKANKSKSSYRRDTVSVKNLMGSFKGLPVLEVTAQDMERYKNMRKEMVSPATINRELSCVKHMFTKAVHWGYLNDNTLRTVTKFREPPGRKRYLRDEEIERLLYCCADHLRPIVITALNTGMRKGEILGLKWSDVDMINKAITVKFSKNHESRSIPINDELYATLIKLPNNSNGSDFVFLGKHGVPIRSIQNAWERALKNAKINDFRFHDLRHTFASKLAIQGVSMRIIQELLGQKTILMTMRYSHLSNKTLRNAVDKLASSSYNDTEFGTKMAKANIEKR